MTVDCWSKNKDKEDNVDSHFKGAEFYVEVSESNNNEDLE